MSLQKILTAIVVACALAFGSAAQARCHGGGAHDAEIEAAKAELIRVINHLEDTLSQIPEYSHWAHFIRFKIHYAKLLLAKLERPRRRHFHVYYVYGRPCHPPMSRW